MNKYFPYILLGLFVAIILNILRVWFSPSIITGGDFWFNFPSMYVTNSTFYYAWLPMVNNGLGGFASIFIPLNFVYFLPIFSLGILLHAGWEIISRLGFFYPYILLILLSPLFLIRKIYPNSKGFFLLLAPFLFFLNTYNLMILGGGQILIVLSYAFSSFVLLSYIYLLEKPTFHRSLLAGLALAIIIMLDLRITYVMLVGVGLYLVINVISKFTIANYEWKNLLRSIALAIVVPGMVAMLLHAFWLIPMAIVKENPLQQLGSAYDTVGAVKFFSFANFENAFGLLHPNWPENIFGEVGFMKPEFLLLPILAYGSLLFIKQKIPQEDLLQGSGADNKKQSEETMYVLFFALLGLLGTFLAKGANDPLGGIYLWCFQHIPGFIMFRDPTKWYLLIALSYSMLIPYTVSKIYELLKRRLS